GFDGIPFALRDGDAGTYWLEHTHDAEDFLVCSAVFRLQPSSSVEIRRRIHEILDYRRRTQPAGERSAGCFFSNPPGGESAGALIEKAGFKGRRRGGALVSPVHANYIVNAGDATAFDVLELALEIAAAVRDDLGVRLAFQVDIWGESLEELIAHRGYF
ncbi:MAG TPA: hypothetical protein ENN09_05610, partial [Planctomycetes bacterium]|nr:hypothetical protein [Planctomycetota bacterium]